MDRTQGRWIQAFDFKHVVISGFSTGTWNGQPWHPEVGGTSEPVHLVVSTIQGVKECVPASVARRTLLMNVVWMDWSILHQDSRRSLIMHIHKLKITWFHKNCGYVHELVIISWLEKHCQYQVQASKTMRVRTACMPICSGVTREAYTFAQMM